MAVITSFDLADDLTGQPVFRLKVTTEFAVGEIVSISYVVAPAPATFSPDRVAARFAISMVATTGDYNSPPGRL